MRRRNQRVQDDNNKEVTNHNNQYEKLVKEIPERRIRIWNTRLFYIVIFVVLVFKTLLSRCYTSTDFEVHRNWMAITWNLPLSQWYYNNVSQWTLDYPPFFAYFERGLSQIASVVDDEMLVIQSEPLMNGFVLWFQRLSVVFLDIIYIIASAIISETLIDTKTFNNNLKLRIKFALFCILVSNPCLIILDNIHFQYNSMLYGLLLLSIAAIFTSKPLLGALLFSILLNFKHINLYYVPAYVLFFLFNYLLPLNFNIIRRTIGLGLSITIPVVISFGPFFVTGGIDGIQQIISRLFPFKRGLTHAYWAPNFWAIYNFADYILFKCFSISKLTGYCNRFKIFKCTFGNPEYTSGLVQEFNHVVLPDIKPIITFALIITFLLPMFFIKNKKNQDLLLYMIVSSYSFFLFGWHVHEKALVMILIPVTLLAFLDLKYMDIFIMLSIITPISLFPLIFTPIEDLVKYTLAIGTLMCMVSLLNFCYHLTWREIISRKNRVILISAVLIELYKVFIHHKVFGNRMEFLPLMITSVFCSLCVLFSYIEFIRITLFDGMVISYKKKKCRNVEKIIRELNLQEKDGFDIKKVNYVAGVDISSFVDEPRLAIVSYSVLRMDDLKCVYSSDKIVLMKNDYIPEYLAIREAEVVGLFVNENKNKYPVDVVLIDGNGLYHSRLCGLACHIGYLTGIPTIGVAKNFNFGPMKAFGYSDDEIRDMEQDMPKKLDKGNSDTSIKIKMIEDHDEILAVMMTSSKSNYLYVSKGYKIDLDSAVDIVGKCLVHSVVEPIRVSDLRSRSLISSLYENGSAGIISK